MPTKERDQRIVCPAQWPFLHHIVQLNMRPFLPSKSVTSTAKKLHPRHNFLVTIEAYLSHLAQTFQNFFDLCLHWVFIVHATVVKLVVAGGGGGGLL